MIGPYLIDWTSYRETFEREAGAYLGKPVKVAGKASIRLLPTPTLNFTDVRVGDDGLTDLTIENIRAELELPALLKGDVRVIQMLVDRPVLRLDVAALAVPWSQSQPDVDDNDGRMDPESVSLDSMEIKEGEILVFDSRTGQQWAISALNAQVEALSLNGPGKIEHGGFILDGEAVSFRASAGRMAANGAVPLKVSLSPARFPFMTRLSGKLLTRTNEGLVYEGGFSTAELTDVHNDEDDGGDTDDTVQAVLQSAGTFRLTTEALELPELQLTYGLRDRPLQLTGNGGLRFGTEPYFDVSLDARQIDIDRALGGGPNDPVAISDAFSAFVENLKSLPNAPVAGELHLDAKGVVVGGSVIQAVGADLRPAADGWHVDILSAVLPGQTRIDLKGRLNLSEDPGFKGLGKVDSKRPAAFSAWWRGVAGRASRIGRFSIEAALDVTGNRQTATDIVADIDGGAIRGSIDIRQFQENGRKIFVDVGLNAKALDLEKAEAVADLFVGDAVSGGYIDRMAVSLEADRLFAGGVDARRVKMVGTLEPAAFDLKTLSVEDLAGARISALGRIVDPFGKPGGRISSEISADDLSGTAQFLEGLFPDHPTVAKFASIAADLSPARAELLLSARQSDSSLSLDLSGSFGGTRINLEMAGAGAPGDLATLRGQIDGLIVADRSTGLLRQAGIDVFPLDDRNPARFSLKADGSLGSGFTVRTDGTLAGIGFGFSGNGRIGTDGVSVTGDFRSSSKAVDDALLLAGVVMPRIGNGLPLDVAGNFTVNDRDVSIILTDGRFDEQPLSGSISAELSTPLRVKGDLMVGSLSVPYIVSTLTGQLPRFDENVWSDSAFVRTVPEDISVDIALSSNELDLGIGSPARNSEFRLVLNTAGVSLDGLKADWAGGRLNGDLNVGVTDQGLGMSLQAAVDGVALQDIIWRKDGRPVAQGTVDGSLSIDARGRSFAGIVSTFNGSGSFRIRNGIVRSINPTAFSSIIRAADTGLVLKPDRVRSVFEGYLDAGSLPFEQASGSFGITSGTIRVSTISFDTASATALGGGMLDLNTGTLSSDWTLKVDPGSEKVTGAEPEVGILFSGSIDNPTRDVDVTPLIGYLTVRAFEKEVTRIEALQANIQEQERLVRLLKIQREQADERVRRAEEAARRAREEEARRAAEEEARRLAEEEAARLAAEEEARRLAEEEAARLAAEEEARRLAEEEAARLAAEEEARRLAEEEAARRAAEEARRLAEEAAAQRAEEEARRLAEEASQSPGGSSEGDQPFGALNIETIIRQNQGVGENEPAEQIPQGDDAGTGSREEPSAELPPLPSRTIDESRVLTEAPEEPAVRIRRPTRRSQVPEEEGPVYKILPNGVILKIR